jgi:uncharacterized protein YndB with AHSA1/START domain
MTDQITIAPVRTATVVDAAIEHAFLVFTKGFGTWWPASHHTGDTEFIEAVLEPREGGRWYERRTDGESEWGSVLSWEPPARVVLAWHLDADFEYDPDPARATEVEVTFTSEGPERTRVELEHRLLERFADRADEVRGKIGSDDGWAGLLALYAKAAATPGA